MVWDIHALGKRRALAVLASLADEHPNPMNTGDFVRASRLTPERARVLRDEMDRAGLTHTTPGPHRGVVITTQIRLTPKGLRIARLAQEIRALLDEP